jgi:large repetitive protein
MTPLRLLPMIAVLTVCGVTAAGGQSPPPGLECGDTITADTTLDRDLTNCPSNGIVIGAEGITLDLNGHSISGDGKLVRRCPRRQPCDIGIANDHSGVTVQNGSVRGFAVGVGVFGVRHNRLVKLASSENQFFGFVIAGSARTVIRNSSGSANPAPDGDGLGVFDSHDLRIVGNSFRRNGQLGMHIESSTDNLIKGNVVARNSDFGIFLEADGNQVRGNRSIRDGVTGIVVGPGSRNVIAGNRVSGGGEGIAIEKGRGNAVVRNVVARTRHSGIRLGIGEPPIGSTNTLVRGNLVTAAGKDGFLVAKSDRNAVLRRNIARRSGDDGFDVNSRSARLSRNRSVGSAGDAFEIR